MIKLKELKPSASMELTRMAKSMKDQGKKVYTLSIGDTHFNLPASLAAEIVNLPEAASHYGSAQGVAKLRESIAEIYEDYAADSVIIVPGLKQGFFYALEAIEGKRVAVLEPSWLGYQATCTLAGCEYLPVNTYKSDWTDTLKSMDFDILMLCSPNNPDGNIITANQVESLYSIATEKDAWVILDLIYERYTYIDIDIKALLRPILGYHKTIVGNGFSKSHAMTGYRIGYLLVKNANVMSNILKIQQNLATCASSFAQHLLSKNHSPIEIENFVSYYRENRETVLNIFPEWKVFAPQGGFYFFVDLSVYGITDASEFCMDLLQNHGIAIVPGAAYGYGFDNYIRISFSLDRNGLEEALENLKNVLTTYHA
ncbi:pyridoxal phosphate-dependent aminotransferase [Cyclobacterium xiamenense]|uniref:pyridoxal phosphate-dependent aminotransferase n=1 Tax=Cyclobacterium xiamenense TaxID=1297121 RepID=UPI0035CFFAD7